MKLNFKKEDEKLTIEVDGRLDTNTAPELEEEMKRIEGIRELVLDFKNLDYISSAGLRVLLSMQKKMNEQGEMKLKNVSKDVMDVFEVTGFSGILTIE